MPLQIHDIEVADGSTLQNQDRIVIAQLWNVANVAGGGAGASVTIPIAFAPGSLPNGYAVMITPNQACFDAVTNKTNTGFNVVLTPVTSATTLAAGTFDVLVVG